MASWQQQKAHYDSHAVQVPTHVALQQRSEGPAEPLKRFHNHVKRQLLKRFAYGVPKLLDMCCGRGGDLHKWKESKVRYVKGLDISPMEIEEAKRRYEELTRKDRREPMIAEFAAEEHLGERPYRDPHTGTYDVATCMFAMHYFFINETSLRMFLRNVSDNLRDDGYFIATVPDGKRVVATLGGMPEYRAEMLHLVQHWEGPPRWFGSGYICNIADTVTSATEHSEGSFEYLLAFECVEAIAREYNLFPVSDYEDGALSTCFLTEDLLSPFKHFFAFFKDAGPGLEEASSLFGAFVLQKRQPPPGVSGCDVRVVQLAGETAGSSGVAEDGAPDEPTVHVFCRITPPCCFLDPPRPPGGGGGGWGHRGLHGPEPQRGRG